MGTPVVRYLMLAVAILLLFGAVVAIGLRLLPAPHSESDYLVVGSVATFVALAALFLALISTFLKTPNVFFKKREKPRQD